jgi:HEAT repeat protein
MNGLIDQLYDDDEITRVAAAYNLGVLGEEAAIPRPDRPARQRRRDGPPRRGPRAGKIGGEEATDALEAALEDEDEVVQRFASEALEPVRRAA